MIEVFAGLALGAAASLHCGAMCGPLVAALHGRDLPRASHGESAGPRASWWMPVVLHHTGRALTYGVLGLAAGTIGQVLVNGGFARGLSIVTGALLVGAAIGLTWPMTNRLGRAAGKAIGRGLTVVRRGGGPAGWRELASGALNALLPCGLVYSALLASSATGAAVPAVLFMLLFGLGTTPLLILVARSARLIGAQAPWRLRFARPVTLALLGLLLVWRGVAGPAVHASHLAADHGPHAAAAAAGPPGP